MVNTFINWLSKYPEFQEPERKAMLDDAIKCYQNGIPRAALLLTYNAFLDAIRCKIINTSFIPEAYVNHKNPNAWNKVEENLKDEEKFDSQLRDLINAKPENSIFDYQTRIHLRDDMLYWVRRRNDCAHCKNSTITLSNVCALWTFIMDNYIYFNLEGTLQRCINDYATLYDPIKTKPGTPDDQIFLILCDVIRSKDDIITFVSELNKKLNNRWYDNPVYTVLHKLLIETKTQTYTIKYLMEQDEEFVLNYLKKYPNDISLLYTKDDKGIRTLWAKYTNQNSSYAPIFIALLESCLIPEDQIEEAIKQQLEGWSMSGYIIPLTPQEVVTLNNNCFISIFERSQLDRLFEKGGPQQKKLCCKTDFYWSILNNFGLSSNMANKMIENYKSDGHFPYTLRELILTNYEDITKNLGEEKKVLKNLMERDKAKNKYTLL